ncbi:ABC transporter substrate-binding protein [Caldilinea sp.]|uniref:ABC transporter substrate-binding protein n=1 Tax=Caldilinea sp. TaxID=2293560 RepID=UPI00261C5E4C|nr:iron-siderophore ABC transporter substrate-binding protein [uncultured Caldilinea sp.]
MLSIQVSHSIWKSNLTEVCMRNIFVNQSLSLLILFSVTILTACAPVVTPSTSINHEATISEAANAAPEEAANATMDTAETTPVAEEAAPTAESVTRTITDAKGNEVAIPAHPKRIVTLTEIELDSALALGLKPVGSVNGRGQPGLPAYLGDQTEGILSVGSLAEPSLEQIVALKPDLILVGAMIPQIEALAPELSQIAPVVATFQANDDWKTAFKSIAHVLNLDDRADAFLAEYNQRVSAIRTAIPAGAEAAVVRWMPQGPVVMMPQTFSNRILADVGFTPPAELQTLAGNHGAHSDPLSLEALESIDKDWLFVGALNAEGASALEEALKDPLVQSLDVVKQGHLILVDGAVWTSIGGPLAALQVLDVIEQAVTAQ